VQSCSRGVFRKWPSLVSCKYRGMLAIKLFHELHSHTSYKKILDFIVECKTVWRPPDSFSKLFNVFCWKLILRIQSKLCQSGFILYHSVAHNPYLARCLNRALSDLKRMANCTYNDDGHMSTLGAALRIVFLLCMTYVLSTRVQFVAYRVANS